MGVKLGATEQGAEGKWQENDFFFPMAEQSPVGPGVLVAEASRSH